MTATLTVTAAPAGNGTKGLFVSFASGGEFSGDDVDRRVYSISSIPPPWLAPRQFWGIVLRDVAACLLANAEIAVIRPRGPEDDGS